MKKIYILAIVISFWATQSIAANVYIRAGSGGDGSTWGSALDNLPSTLIRGNTYYLADGSYGSYTFDDADSGTTYIYIKKATASDHGTETGWNSSYGDGQAIFTTLTILCNYLEIDGQVGQWADFLPSYVAHGIKVSRTTTGDGQHVVHIGGSGNNKNYIILKHIEITYGNTPRTGTWHRDAHALWGYGSNWTIQYCWAHDSGGCNLLSIGGSNSTIDRCAFGRNGHAQVAMGWSTSEHSENMMWHPGGDSWTITNSYFYDWRSTGNWVLYGGNDNFKFTGNFVFTTGYWSVMGESGDSDGIFQACMHGDAYGGCLNNKVINNTFADIPYGGRIASMTLGSVSGLQIENNLFYDVKSYLSNNIDLIGTGYRQYNWYYDCGTFTSETGQQNGIGNPFVNSAAYDYSLLSHTNAGASGWAISPYNIDIASNTRGADGVWDRGALEYTGIDSAAPTVSTASVNGSTATINFSDSVVSTNYVAGDFNLDCTNPTASNIALSSPSGSGSSRTFSLASPVVYGQVCNLDYLGRTNGIEDAAGNDLAAQDDITISNTTPDTTAPTVSGALPTGEQECSSAPRNVTASVTTNEAATCRYGWTNTTFGNMANFSTTGGTSHSTILSGLSCGSSYTLYVLCADGSANISSPTTEIDWSIASQYAPRGITGTGIIKMGSIY